MAATGRVCAPPTKMAFVCHARRGRSRRGGGEELVEDPNGIGIEQCAKCLIPVKTTTGHFLLSGWGVGRELVAPLTNEEGGGGRRPPQVSALWPRCAMRRHCPGSPCKGMWGLGCRWGVFWW